MALVMVLAGSAAALALAFAMNVPMAHVTAPAGYGDKAIEAIARPGVASSPRP